MDIATKFASGQEAVEAIFRKDKQPQGRPSEEAPETSTPRGAKKKGKKKSQSKRDAADADLVAAAEYKNPRKPPGGANLFDKMLKEPCPYHQGPVKHTLEERVMLRRHFHRAGPPAEGGKACDDDKKEDHQAGEFPEVRDCFMIYGGQAANASARHRKQERREVCSVKVAAPVYLDWSDKPITFDQADHPDHVPSPGMPLGVALRVCVTTKSFPISPAGISKKRREPTWCTPNTPAFDRARPVITVAYGRGFGSPWAPPSPGMLRPARGFAAPPGSVG